MAKGKASKNINSLCMRNMKDDKNKKTIPQLLALGNNENPLLGKSMKI